MLLNRQYVLDTVMIAAVRKIALVLRISDSAVIARWSLGEGGTFRAEFGVDPKVASGLTEDEIRAVLKTVWVQEKKPELQIRLMGIEHARLMKDGSSDKES
jgi:hypothetical protein